MISSLNIAEIADEWNGGQADYDTWAALRGIDLDDVAAYFAAYFARHGAATEGEAPGDVLLGTAIFGFMFGFETARRTGA